MDDTVVFLGAGFSKASGLRTTKEVEAGFLDLSTTRATPDPDVQTAISSHLTRFWQDVFGWRAGKYSSTPSLEDHFTLVDSSANTGHNLGHYTPRQLRAIRRLSIHRVFDILDQEFKPSEAARELLKRLGRGEGNAVITTNWDTAVEKYLTDANITYDYGVEAHYVYGDAPTLNGLPVLKLHGSSSWTYCDSCRRIYVGQPGGGKAALHAGTFLREDDFEALGPPIPPHAALRSPTQRFRCRYCHVELSARVATFSFMKALGFFQFQAVWDRALSVLRESKTWIFIGYSLPQADFEIRGLLKTAQLAGDEPPRILGVPGRNAAARENYEKFFGNQAKVFRSYLDEWWRRQKSV